MGYYNNDFTKMDIVKDLLNAYQERDLACFQEHAKTALDVSVKSRENGRKGGLLVAERMRGAKASPVKSSAAESDPMGMLLKGIVLSVAEDSAESKGKK